MRPCRRAGKCLFTYVLLMAVESAIKLVGGERVPAEQLLDATLTTEAISTADRRCIR